MRHPAAHISDHLLVYLSLAFITGIATAARFTPTPMASRYFGCGLFVVLGLLALLHFFRWRRTVLCLLLPLTAGLGFYHTQLALQVPSESEHIFNRIQEKTEAVVIGTMAAAPEFDGKLSKVLLISEYLRLQESPQLLPTTGKILLHFQGKWPVTLVPGDMLVIRADLRRPDGFRAPGVFDYSQHLARKGIWVSGFIRSPVFVQKIEEGQGLLHRLHYLPERLRMTIGEFIDSAVPPASQGIYRAILIGDVSQVDDATLETFKGSGTMHILAISGLHMTVIFVILYTILYWLLNRSEHLLFRYPLRKWASFCCLPVLLGYGLLAGLNAPVYRAIIMSCVIIVAICTDRPKSSSTLLACAALVILTGNPLALFTASFQLSFVATMAILFLFPLLKKLILPDSTAETPTIKRVVVNWLLAGLLVSTVATLATTPITLFAFNRVSPVGIIANLIVEPLICLWSLTAGFLAIPWIFLQPEVSAWIFRIGAVGLSAAVQATTFFASLPFATIWLPAPPIWLMLTFYAGLLGCILCGKLAKIWLCSCAFLVLVSLQLILYPAAIQKKPADTLQLAFLDVGQGSSTLAQFPSGMTVLIDGGGSSFASSVGERVIAPYLWHRGIQKLDAVIITHPDADHYNGLEFIIKRFSPKQLWVRDRQGHEPGFRQLIALAETQGTSVITPEEGMQLMAVEKRDFIECLANDAAGSTTSGSQESRSQANTGLIIRVCSQGHCALFPGDIDRAEEHSLVRHGYDLHADLLLAPHHGSITSNSPEFLAAVAPRLMLVSAGRGGQGHFPHDHLRDDCKALGINLLTTARYGTLEVSVTEAQLQVIGYHKNNNNPLLSYAPFPVTAQEALQEKEEERD